FRAEPLREVALDAAQVVREPGGRLDRLRGGDAHHVARQVVGHVDALTVGCQAHADRRRAHPVRHLPQARLPRAHVGGGVEVEAGRDDGVRGVDRVVAVDDDDLRLRRVAEGVLGRDRPQRVGHARLRGIGAARPEGRRRREQRGHVGALALARLEDVVAVEHQVDDVGRRAVGREFDVGRVVRLVDVELADQVAVARVELVDSEARDVVEGCLVDVAVDAPGRERPKRGPREQARAGQVGEEGAPLEEALAQVVLLRAADPELVCDLGGRAVGHEGDGGDEVQRALPRVLRLAGRGVRRDREHPDDRRAREIDHAHVRVVVGLLGEIVAHVCRPAVARDRDGTRVRPRQADADGVRELGIEDDELARPLAGDQHAVARGRDRDAVWGAAEAQVDGAERAPQIRLVEPPEAVVLLPGGEDVGPVERERARVLADGALVGEQTRRRAEVETSDAARIGIDDEDVAVGRDREWTRAGGQRAGGCRGQRRTEHGRGGAAALLYLGVRPLLPEAAVWLARAAPPALLATVHALLAFAVLVVPTTLLGATLPAATATLAPDDASGAGRLYAWNTCGGALGALGCGVVAIRVLGVRGAFLAAAGLDAAVAAAALALARRTAAPAARRETGAQGAPPRLALVLAAAAGFAGLADEVLWTRGLAGVLSQSVYSIALVLAAVLVGIALGAVTGVRALGRAAAPEAWLGIAFAALALATLLSQLALRALPGASVLLVRGLGVFGPGAGLAVEAALAARVVLGPARA